MKKISLYFMFVLFLNGEFGEPVSVSVMEGDSVTLNTGLTEIQKDDVLEWRFGAGRDLIARINKAAGITKTYDDVLGGNFKDRLKLDDQTGSLTITDIRTTDSGEYEVTTAITTFGKTFNVRVNVVPDSGLSPGAIAGIVVAVLLLPVAAAVGFYYRYRTRRQEL